MNFYAFLDGADSWVNHHELSFGITLIVLAALSLLTLALPGKKEKDDDDGNG